MQDPRDESTHTVAVDSTKTQVLGLDKNVAGLLCYTPLPMVGLVCSILWLCTEPKSNTFVRFHAIQSLVLTVVAIIACTLLTAFGGFGLGFLAALVSPLISLAVFIACIMCMVKAWKGEMYKLPILGDLSMSKV